MDRCFHSPSGAVIMWNCALHPFFTHLLLDLCIALSIYGLIVCFSFEAIADNISAFPSTVFSFVNVFPSFWHIAPHPFQTPYLTPILTTNSSKPSVISNIFYLIGIKKRLILLKSEKYIDFSCRNVYH